MESLVNFIVEALNKGNNELSLSQIKDKIYDSKEDILDELGFDPFDKNFDGDMKSAVKKIESSNSVYIALDNIKDKNQGYFGFLYKDGSSITFESPSSKVMDGYFYGSTMANDITSEVIRYVCTFAKALGKFTNKTKNIKFNNDGLYVDAIQDKTIILHVFDDPEAFGKFSKQLIRSNKSNK